MPYFEIQKSFSTSQGAYKTIKAKSFAEAKRFYEKWNGENPDSSGGFIYSNGTEMDDTIRCESTGEWVYVSQIDDLATQPDNHETTYA